MQTVDSSLPSGGPSGTVEQFTARNATGRLVVIEKLGAAATENPIGGLEWSRAGPAYRVKAGGDVERIDESTFRIVDTGEVVRREEGRHGVTHHPQHQTPGQP